MRGYLEEGHKRLCRPSDLGLFARRAIGLWQMGVTDERRIADIVYQPSDSRPAQQALIDFERLHAKVVRFLGFCLESPHPVVRYVIDHGLPACCSAPLPEGKSVLCPECGGIINSAPCVACVPGHITDDELAPDEYAQIQPVAEDKPFLMPKQKTYFRPGTQEKIEIMRQRIERGESAFHPKDAKMRR